MYFLHKCGESFHDSFKQPMVGNGHGPNYFIVEYFSNIIFVGSFSHTKETNTCFIHKCVYIFICTFFTVSVEKEFVSMAPSSLHCSSSIFFVSISTFLLQFLVFCGYGTISTSPSNEGYRLVSVAQHINSLEGVLQANNPSSSNYGSDISSLQLRIRSLHDFKFHSLISPYYTQQHRPDLNDPMEMVTLLN